MVGTTASEGTFQQTSLLEANKSKEDSPDDNPEEVVKGAVGTTKHHSLPQHHPTFQQLFRLSGNEGGDVEKTSQVFLRQIIDNEQYFTLFRQFVKDQGITRNLNFWLACEGYRIVDPNKRLEPALALYFKFLKRTAPSRVNISGQTLRKIQITLRLNMEPNQNLFDEAQEEVLQMMAKNELRQFLSSLSIDQARSEVLYTEGVPCSAVIQTATYEREPSHSRSLLPFTEVG